MAKRSIKEKEIIGYLKEEGFKEIKVAEKHSKWYKKASQRPSCLEEDPALGIVGLGRSGKKDISERHDNRHS
ncbi:MAG: hypothetical protein HY754_00850 [Nitrospirae bacterium]|nr:hypothetical protein [Nitrospirota bacterium]